MSGRKPLSLSLNFGGNKRFETDEFGYYVNLGASYVINNMLKNKLEK